MNKLLPVALAAALLAGCGSDTDQNSEYARSVNAAQTQFFRTAGQASARLPDRGTTAQYRSTVRSYQRAIDTAIGRLRMIAVPEEVRPEHDQLVAALVDFGREMRTAGDTLREPTPTRVATVPGRLQDAASQVNTRLRTATVAINSKLGVG